MPSASVLPAPHRLNRGDDLRRVSRAGNRSGCDRLVVHLMSDLPDLADPGCPAQARVGFVVGRAVGNSVIRHRVQRRLRHLVRERLDALPPGSRMVVRALAPAASASYAELGADLDRCLRRALDNQRSDRPARGQGSVS